MNQQREDEILSSIQAFKPGSEAINVIFYAYPSKASDKENITYIGYKEIYEKALQKHSGKIDTSFDIAFWSGKGGCGLITSFLNNFDYLRFMVESSELETITQKACKIIAQRQQ